MEDSILSEADRKKAHEWLKQFVHSCPCCYENEFSVSGHITYSYSLNSSVAIPLLKVLCNHCGYVLSFGAVKLGLVEGPNMWTD